jgi:hypothetical protein
VRSGAGNIRSSSLAHGSIEELCAWLDWSQKKDQEAEEEAEAELIAAGGFGQGRLQDQGMRAIMSRISADGTANRRKYRFAKDKVLHDWDTNDLGDI